MADTIEIDLGDDFKHSPSMLTESEKDVVSFDALHDAAQVVKIHEKKRWYLPVFLKGKSHDLKCELDAPLRQCGDDHSELLKSFIQQSHATQEDAIFDIAKQLCDIQISHYTPLLEESIPDNDSTELKKKRDKYERQKKTFQQLSACLHFIAEELFDGKVEQIHVDYAFTAELRKDAYLACDHERSCSFRKERQIGNIVLSSRDSRDKVAKKLDQTIQRLVSTHKEWHANEAKRTEGVVQQKEDRKRKGGDQDGVDDSHKRMKA